MTIEQMKQEKKRKRYTYKEIADRSGISLKAVQKIFSGTTKAPRQETLAALERVFLSDAEPADEKAGVSDEETEKVSRKGTEFTEEGMSGSFTGKCTGEGNNSMLVHDSSFAYGSYQSGNTARKFPRQGEYTLEDYLALPEDLRVELIDGVFYEMLAPYPVHQDICFMLGHYFQNFIEANHGKCRVLPSPVDVQLDKDDKTVLEPDLCICCDMSKVQGPRIYGAPDMLIEILSKSTRKKDLTLKNWKYSNAGVREYWTVDPARLQVTVFDYAHEDKVTLYSFHDKVPVGIYDGKLVIDFEKILERIQGMYGVGTDK